MSAFSEIAAMMVACQHLMQGPTSLLQKKSIGKTMFFDARVFQDERGQQRRSSPPTLPQQM
jgi:hypothetical protein